MSKKNSKLKLEKDNEDSFVEKANQLGYYALKLTLLGRRGWPDRTLIGYKQIFFIEFKRPGNKLSGPQRYWKRIIESLGFEYYVCFSYREAIDVINKKLKELELYREGESN